MGIKISLNYGSRPFTREDNENIYIHDFKKCFSPDAKRSSCCLSLEVFKVTYSFFYGDPVFFSQGGGGGGCFVKVFGVSFCGGEKGGIYKLRGF